jgi:hypothetical protein
MSSPVFFRVSPEKSIRAMFFVNRVGGEYVLW